MLYAAIILGVILPFGFVAARMWISRRDVWIPMHGAMLFARGDVVSLGTSNPTRRFRVLSVSRRSLKVRPL